MYMKNLMIFPNREKKKKPIHLPIVKKIHRLGRAHAICVFRLLKTHCFLWRHKNSTPAIRTYSLRTKKTI